MSYRIELSWKLRDIKTSHDGHVCNSKKCFYFYVNIAVFVCPGEQPAAMQHGNGAALPPAPRPLTLLLALALALLLTSVATTAFAFVFLAVEGIITYRPLTTNARSGTSAIPRAHLWRCLTLKTHTSSLVVLGKYFRPKSSCSHTG